MNINEAPGCIIKPQKSYLGILDDEDTITDDHDSIIRFMTASNYSLTGCFGKKVWIISCLGIPSSKDGNELGLNGNSPRPAPIRGWFVIELVVYGAGMHFLGPTRVGFGF